MNHLAEEIYNINKQNGWNVLTPEDWKNEHKIPAKLALIHSEISEALEAFRAGDQVNFAEELADTIIRTLDCSHGLGFDMNWEIKKKLVKNRERGFRHGGKRV